MEDKNHGPAPDAATELEMLLSRRASNLYGALKIGSKSGVYSLTFRQKGPRSWLAVARRVEVGTTRFQVLFASSETWAGSLVQLGKELAAGKWSTDKFAPK